MRNLTPALLALLNAAGGINALPYWEFFTFTLSDGTTMLRYGGAPFKLTAANATIWDPPNFLTGAGMWFAGISWPASRMGARDDMGQIGEWSVGLDANSWTLQFAAPRVDPFTGTEFPDEINGVPWIEAAQAGALDNADCIVSRAYFAAGTPASPIAVAGASPVGTVILQRGMVGNVDCGDEMALIHVTDYRALLKQQMPRNLYQGACRHRVYDSRCTLDSTLFDASAVVNAGSAGSMVIATAPVLAPGGSGTYTLGLLTMTSGDNNGFKRLVSTWDGSARFQLLNPFPYPLAAGDTFTVTAGCDKRLSTCQAFANEDNFGGYPFIPMPEVAL